MRRNKMRLVRSLSMMLCAGLVLTLAILPVYAEEVKEGKKAEEQQKVLTLNEVLKKCAENNLEIKKASLNLDNAKVTYQKGLASYLQTESKIDEEQTKLNWERAQWTFEKTKSQIQLGVISSYINLKDLKAKFPLQEKTLAIAERNLKKIKEKVKAGIAGKTAELGAEINLRIAQQGLSQTQRDMERTSKSFAYSIGIEDSLEYDFVTIFKFEGSLVTNSLDEYIQQALDKRKEMKFAQKDVEIANLKLEKLEIENASSLDIDKAANDLKLFQIALESQKENIKEDVQNKYCNLKTVEDQISLQTIQLEKSKEELENTRQQFQMKMIIEDDLASQEISYQKAELDYEKSLVNYFIAYQNLLLAIGGNLNFEDINGN